MEDHRFVDQGPPTPGGTRGRVLETLRDAAGPLGARDVATRLDLHLNTARYHLDALVRAGLAERESEDRGQAGRPRTVYQAVGNAVGRRSYRLLAEMLTGLVAERLPHPESAGAEVGMVWGRYLTETPAPWEHVDAEDGLRRLVAVLDEAGFAPEAELTDGTTADEPARGKRRAAVIRLRHCPFREVAERHPKIVCAMHLGMIKGVLAETRAPLEADRLEPFVDRSLCLTHVSATGDPPTP